ncbi:MAG: hypothetical protein RQ741_02750 [Wenzhouxiangellaceae bacterium]|nr:hypothetical protein [Wenzhouxiangellaceae bacterium]
MSSPSSRDESLAGSDQQRLSRLRERLEQARRERRTLTYLELAEHLSLSPPQRIRQLTRLLEALMETDASAGRPTLAALVVSRTHPGLPARGFFDRATTIGLFDGRDPKAFHDKLLSQLFDDNGNTNEQ